MPGRVVCFAEASTLLVLGAGCTSEDDDAVDPAPIETLTAATPSVRGSAASATTTPATTTTILDLDTYAYGSEYAWAREIRASEILIAGCMEEHALDYVMSQPVDAQSLAAHNAALLAPLTLEEVQTFGYAYNAHRIAGANGVEAASVTDQTNPVSMEEYVGSTDCGEQTAQRLGAISRNIVLHEFASAAASIRQRADSDPRVVETLDAWSACMAVSGYDVRYPEDASGWPRVWKVASRAGLRSTSLSPTSCATTSPATATRGTSPAQSSVRSGSNTIQMPWSVSNTPAPTSMPRSHWSSARDPNLVVLSPIPQSGCRRSRF